MNKTQKLTQQWLSVALFAAIVAMLGWLSTRYKLELDWTAGHRNTLTAGSRKLLATMHDPIDFVAFVSPTAETRRDIEQWLARYKRFKSDIRIRYVDPQAHPEKVKEYNIDAAGEVVVEYEQRRETIRALSEQTVTGALQRLSYSGERYVVFLEGHGERPTVSKSEQDFGLFAQTLREKGLKVQGLNLAQTPSIPDNTSVLVLASPTGQLLAGEIKLIQDYLGKGGNLLWLADPDSPHQADLEKALGVHWQDGVAIFPNYQLLGTGSPGIFLATAYPEDNPITRELDEVTAFPLARSLTFDKDSGWKASPMLLSDKSAWLETGPLDGPVGFDADKGDIAGPLLIGLSLTRERPATGDGDGDPAAKNEPAKDAGKDAAKDAEKKVEQRIALVGDADFLADANLGQLGNKHLGLNLVQRLATRDAQLDIDVPKAPDRDLYVPGWATIVIGLGFILVLPAGLLAFGVIRWAIRRRQ